MCIRLSERQRKRRLQQQHPDPPGDRHWPKSAKRRLAQRRAGHVTRRLIFDQWRDQARQKCRTAAEAGKRRQWIRCRIGTDEPRARRTGPAEAAGEGVGAGRGRAGGEPGVRVTCAASRVKNSGRRGRAGRRHPRAVRARNHTIPWL
ncbi:hypothetical protein EJF18_60173 [Clavispora lusitaniae]|uniref:Uncharacterized protein n=1 Tax=Clavispora lusitaniae TaxID=36911 RepID=A0ACD0WRN2_CLALS|nr:hypothetical protein EJF14_60173 [Clavispora lusitaniae]QFZ35312.1 hypothetical protein EJF16_60173 [Clavispora lusitaniae]QFZ41006.1 hypothetical protein EJF15_60173 [Clavispora lusitaniae]QFZ46687.1 hypothetical protein EJF18_60173 [Clavispora lusitaniae]QFZ52352.1 hypothetical protein EJF17_60173 [Clavispora lusitaniae]